VEKWKTGWFWSTCNNWWEKLNSLEAQRSAHVSSTDLLVGDVAISVLYKKCNSSPILSHTHTSTHTCIYWTLNMWQMETYTNYNSMSYTTLVDSPARNYFRLARLTLIEGTDQIRQCVLDRLPAGQTLHSALERNRNKMDDLHRRRVISDKQWLLLYPENTNVDTARIDITLWITLLRNIVPLSRSEGRNIRRSKAPNEDETEWFHDVLRIKETRNSLAHLIRPEVDNESFDRLWRYITSALQRLDWWVLYVNL